MKRMNRLLPPLAEHEYVDCELSFAQGRIGLSGLLSSNSTQYLATPNRPGMKEAAATPVTNEMFAGVQEQLAELRDILLTRAHPDALSHDRCHDEVPKERVFRNAEVYKKSSLATPVPLITHKTKQKEGVFQCIVEKLPARIRLYCAQRGAIPSSRRSGDPLEVM